MSSLSTLTIAVLIGGALVVAWILWSLLRGRKKDESSPQEAYTQALSALIGGNRRLALMRFKEAVQQSSDNLDAYIRMGDLLRESGEVQKALAVHRDLTVRPNLPDHDRARILESMTRDYLAAGKYEEAGQSAERLRSLDRGNRFAYRALQQVAEALEDWPRAVKVVEERVKHRGGGKADLARYLGYVGEQLQKAGNRPAARKHFEEALRLDPSCLLAQIFLGDMDQEDGEMEKAVERWRALALAAPARAGLVFGRLERAFFELGHFGEVVAFYRELVDRAPRDASIPALLALAEIHRRKGDVEDAEAIVQEALEIDPTHPRAHRHMVKLALDRGDPSEAIARLDRLLQILPSEELPGACSDCSRPLSRPTWRCPHCGHANPMGM